MIKEKGKSKKEKERKREKQKNGGQMTEYGFPLPYGTGRSNRSGFGLTGGFIRGIVDFFVKQPGEIK